MKLKDATPEEVQEWRKTDYMSSMRFSPLVMFVIIPTIVQACCLAMMGMSMYIASIMF